MSKALTLFGRHSRMAMPAPGEPYEVSLLRKLPRYQVDTGQVSVIQHEWVYSTIVFAEAPALAVYEALYEYFAWRLTKKWQTRKRSLMRRELTLIDLFAKDLAESAMRRFGSPSEMIHALVSPWEPGCVTLHFAAPR